MKFNTLLAAFLGATLLAPVTHASHTAATSLGSGSAINTESAVPLAPGSWSLGTRWERLVSDRLSDDKLFQIKTNDPDANLHSIDQLNAISLDFAYGLTANVTLGLTVPWVERKDDDIDAEGGFFEQEFQPGSGSWDPFVGIAYTRGFGRFGLDTSVTYTLVNEGSQDTDLGDYLAYNAGLAYALTPDAPLRWNAVVELNGLWCDQQEIGSGTLANSGGSWLELTPGIALSGVGWTAFANVGLPIVNNPNGDQDQHDYRFLLGFRLRH